LVELLAVIALLTILTALAFPNLSDYLGRAREVACVANLKSITAATHSYLADHESVWPQSPAAYNSPGWETSWIESLEPYGPGSKTWQCPQIAAQLGSMTRDERGIPRIHYTPTGFPPVKGIAYRWAKQPWFTERANGHGKGSLIAFPDGTIKPLFKILAEQGVR